MEITEYGKYLRLNQRINNAKRYYKGFKRSKPLIEKPLSNNESNITPPKKKKQLSVSQIVRISRIIEYYNKHKTLLKEIKVEGDIVTYECIACDNIIQRHRTNKPFSCGCINEFDKYNLKEILESIELEDI